MNNRNASVVHDRAFPGRGTGQPELAGTGRALARHRNNPARSITKA